MNGYVAMYNGKSVDIYADSLYAAKVKAEQEFKPPKSKTHMITVMLAKKDGKPVIHAPLF